MATTRVYILAKELGVTSSSIVEKCKSEGLENITNHMSTISAGLSATIREWFSGGDNVTTIETAEKVNLEKVKIAKKKAHPHDVDEGAEKAVDEAETVKQEPLEAQPLSIESGIQEQAVQAEPEVQVQAELPVEQPIEVVVEHVKHPKHKVPPVSRLGSAVVEEFSKLPDSPVVLAGPKLEKPSPAVLSGPTIIRVEKPEPAPAPRYKPRTKHKFDAPATEPLITSEQKAIISPKTEAKKPHKDRTHGRRHGAEVSVEEQKRLKFDLERRQRDIEERQARLTAIDRDTILRYKPSRKIETKAAQQAQPTPTVRPDKAVVSEPIIIKDLSSAMGVKITDVITKLMKQGILVTANQSISNEVAEILALEFGVELEIQKKLFMEDKIRKEFEERSKEHLMKRPSIATMLGHVDHGKTSLLDKIRSTQVAASEAGGITQHIGAHQIVRGDKRVTFLDTPGHEAFTAMRARGANMTDVAVLVVAADDGIMPQTIEAINHAKAAGVQIIVALNKADLPGWDVNRVFAQLSEYGLTPVEWGGNTEVVKTSAITGMGVDDLLDHLDYVSELLDLKADNTIPAVGWVVEAKMSAQKGVIATILVKEGKLSKGDAILAGSSYGKVKSMKDSFGRSIKVATSSMPVEITGLDCVPKAGDRFYCLADDVNRAKVAAEENKTQAREMTLAKRTQVTLDNLFTQIEAGSVKELNVIIRADVEGSVGVLIKYISELSTEEVKIKILHASTGGISEGDVVLAEASNAIVIGFNVVPDERVRKIAEAKGVDIRIYTIIYRITDDIRKSMVGLLDPEQKEQSVGRAVVRSTFKVSKVGTIAGCFVLDGFARKKTKVRLIRNNIVVRDDLSMESLKHFKDDAREVKAGLECGIKLQGYDDVKDDDILEFFEMIEVARTL